MYYQAIFLASSLKNDIVMAVLVIFGLVWFDMFCFGLVWYDFLTLRLKIDLVMAVLVIFGLF